MWESLRIKKVMSRKEMDKKRQNVRSRGRMSKAIKEAEKILKQYYGYDHFREGQIPVIEAVLERESRYVIRCRHV